MAAGTWNQGELEKRVTKIDLENLPTIEFRDTSLISDGIFDVVEFPNRFTAGKNLIKIRANNSDTLIKNSKIYIEILDSNGDPIYYEPLDYLEHDGTRVISIYIYPDKTAPGIGTVYLAGRTRYNLDSGDEIPFSKNYKDINYINNPNILWSRSISIAPENSKNNTEIIFTRPYPKGIIRERVNKFFAPINLTDVAVDREGTGTVTLKAIPATTAPKFPKSVKKQSNYEGGASARTPMKSVGKQVLITPAVKSFRQTPADVAANKKGQPIEVESAEIVTISTFSRLETTGFALSSSMEGGTITIVNPNVDILQGNSALNPDEHVVPKSQMLQGDADHTTPFQLTNTAFQLSGSYTFVIDKILSSTKANVFQTTGFKNEDENTFGAFSFISHGAQSEYEIKDINATSNFTCSFVLPFVLSETEQSQSFAEIILSNIEPATGDVHKIQTLYKPSGQFGDFIDAGSVEVEQVEIFEDVTSYESIQSVGMVYNRIGFFTDLSDFNKYWETSNGPVTPEVALTPAYKPDVLLDGIELTPDTNFDSTSNRFGYLHLKSEYHPKAYANTRYELTFNAVANDVISTDPNIKYPRLDVYISGSKNSIEINSEYIDQYKISNLDIPENEFNLGTRISTIELTPGRAYDEVPLLLYFKNLSEQNIDVYFVPRRGKWAFSNLSLKSDKQTGFSPNYTRINTRIPSEFLETPLTFKFRYFDIHNNRAQAETEVHPVTFYGDNLVIGGTNNLLEGSVYIGNTIGSGIELAGVNSGFIRSIGYEGFKSASRTDQPGGFMLYTGSVLPNAPDNYAGVGIEIVQDSTSFFKFDTTNGIDVRAKKFFIGTEDSQFVSGSTGNIEISSSNFHLQPDGGLVIGGSTVIKADLSVKELFIPAETDASDARAMIDTTGVAKFSGDGAGAYKVVLDGNGTSTIGSWIINDASLSGGSGGTTIALTPGSGIHMGNASFGSAPFSVTNAGVLKASSGTVGGWTLGNDRITGGDMIIRENGTIESAGFVSNLAGSGFRLTAASGGFLEVENARIRGTLSTAVFEKETVNAVGGQLYVANSTTLTGSIENPEGSYSATDTTMSVVNSSGFASGEILSAKKISSTGFNTEYLKVNSSSRNNIDSDTDFSGKIFVTRAYGSGVTGDSGSLGGSPGIAVGYTGSQVIVSTGKVGTGYIRLNANPNDQATPYMQIVERTGNGIYDLDLKAQLGDLSGITDNINGTDVSGFGLYTDNAFLKGGIVATYGSIGALNISSQSISIGAGTHGHVNTGFFVSGSGDFSLGDKFVWDKAAATLTIKGAIRQTPAGATITDYVDRGTWSGASIVYAENDLVQYNDSTNTSTYKCINAHTSTNNTNSTTGRPDTATNSWVVYAAGSTGAAGSAGSDGANAKNISVSADSLVFVKSQNGTYSPASITISGSGQNLTANGSWTKTAGTLTNKVESGNNNSCKVTSANFVDGMKVTFTTHGDDGSLTDSITLKELDEGSGNITAILSNEAHVFPANSSGTVSSYSDSGTTIKVFEGATALTFTTGTPAAGQFAVSVGNTANITEGGPTGNGTTTCTIGQHSAAADGTDEYVITYTITGKTANGTSFSSFTKTQSLSKSKSGTNGSNGTNGTDGAGVVFRGVYDASKAYFHTSTRKDLVEGSDGNYYIVNNESDSGTTNWGNPAAGHADWTSFGAQFSSVATDILLAQDVFAERTVNIGASGGSPVIALDADDGNSNANPFIGINASAYNANNGIFLGFNNTTGSLSLKNSDGTKHVKWDGSDLDIKASNFELTPQGNITASNALFSGYVESRAMRQGTVTINASNASQFLRHFIVVVSGGNIKVTDIFLDGSLGGPEVTHIILDIDAFSDPDDGEAAGTAVDLGTTNAAGDAISGAQADELQLGSIRNIFPPEIKSTGGKAKITMDIANGKTVTMFIDKNSDAGMGKQFSQIVSNPTQRTVSYG